MSDADKILASHYRDIIVAKASKYSFPSLFVAALVMVESSGITWTVRWEPDFFDRYLRVQEVKGIRPCTSETERRMRATSFGLMQIMGQVARERGFTGTYLTALCDPEVGIEFGCLHLSWTRDRLAKRGINDAASLCAAYNGGLGAVVKPGTYRNPEYPGKVLAALGGSWEMQSII